MVFIYTLELTNNKYYVGKTMNPGFRLDSHFNANGSVWTTKYKPVKVLELIENCDDYDEDKYTLKYMEKYGIDNVRGGTFCETELTDENKNTIGKMINGSTDKCYICGEKGHYAARCGNKPKYENIDMCFRCGRKYHLAANCYAKYHIQGKSMEACYRCGREGHWVLRCSEQTDIYNRKIGSFCVIM